MRSSNDGSDAEPEPTLADLGEFVPFFIRSIANRLAQAASRSYNRKFGIGLHEWSCLAPLAIKDDLSASRICESSGFDKGLISRSVGALESKGLIESRPVEDHNRRRLIRLTPAGRALYLEIRELALLREKRLLQGLSAEERTALVGYLEIMQRNATELMLEVAADDTERPHGSDIPRTSADS